MKTPSANFDSNYCIKAFRHQTIRNLTYYISCYNRNIISKIQRYSSTLKGKSFPKPSH